MIILEVEAWNGSTAYEFNFELFLAMHNIVLRFDDFDVHWMHSKVLGDD